MTDDLLNRTDDLRAVRFLIQMNEGLLGQRKVFGLLRLEPQALVLEYEKQSNVMDKFIRFLDDGPAGGKTVEKHIPLADVENLKVASSFWTGISVELRTLRMQHLEGVPGAQAGVLKLPINKADRKDAEALVSRALLLQSEQRMRRQGLLD